MRVHAVLLAGLVGVVAVGARAQARNVSGAPFTAIWTTTTESPAGTKVETAILARASNGSVYRADLVDGRIRDLRIEDATTNRITGCKPELKACTIWTPFHSLLPKTAVEEQARLERLEKLDDRGLTEPPAHIFASGRNVQYDTGKRDTEHIERVFALGTKQENGKTLYGLRNQMMDKKGDIIYQSDSWSSADGLTLFVKTDHAEEKMVVTSKLEEIQFIEPDAALFVIPKSYGKSQIANFPTRDKMPQMVCDAAPIPDENCLKYPQDVRPAGVTSHSPTNADSLSNNGQPQLGSPAPGPH
jgi:hypothetical protein